MPNKRIEQVCQTTDINGNDKLLVVKSGSNVTRSVTVSDFIHENSINTGEISNCAITDEKISDDAIKTHHMADNTIDGRVISTGTLDAGKIMYGTLDANKVNVTNLDANNITTGTLDANKVNVTNLDANNITTGTLDANIINECSITTDKLANIIDDSTMSTASDTTLATSDSIKAYVDTTSIGVNQKWSLLTNNINDVPFAANWNNHSGTTFTNNSDTPISVHVWAFTGLPNEADHTRIYIQFDPGGSDEYELIIATNTNSGGGQETAGSIIVPAGTSYRFRNYDPAAPQAVVSEVKISILS